MGNVHITEEVLHSNRRFIKRSKSERVGTLKLSHFFFDRYRNIAICAYLTRLDPTTNFE